MIASKKNYHFSTMMKVKNVPLTFEYIRNQLNLDVQNLILYEIFNEIFK